MPGQVRPVADERDGLLSYLAQQRDVIRIAAYGLTDEQARATPSAGPLSVGQQRSNQTLRLDRPFMRGPERP